eukprot:scaffold130_cov89-Cylindrotheca_fusiformis.AAC.1
MRYKKIQLACATITKERVCNRIFGIYGDCNALDKKPHTTVHKYARVWNVFEGYASPMRSCFASPQRLYSKSTDVDQAIGILATVKWRFSGP